jgi:hypothetical protein
VIIHQDTEAGVVGDIANDCFAARREDAFLKKTGSLPADSRGWANDYARFSSVPGQAEAADDVRIARIKG